MNSKIFISNSREELYEHFAMIIIDILAKVNRNINFALSGGSTPKAIFDFWASNFKDKIEWERINFFWGDERCVPPDHTDSNYLMTFDHLLSKINIPQKNIFRIEGNNEPEFESKRYSKLLLEHVPPTNKIPSFDLIMLGLGEDGHTASIFPNSINLIDDPGICAVSKHPSTDQKRITLTGTIINNAAEVVFFITGEKKSKIVEAILNKREGFEKLPAAHINPDHGELMWLLDKGASKLLTVR